MEYDLSLGISEHCAHKALPNLDFKICENKVSVTIDVIDIMFLDSVEQCEHYDIDHGHHMLQFRLNYLSPNEDEHYGSISLTFYLTNACLHLQGSSYLLSVEE